MASIQVRKETGTLIIDFYYQGKRCREQTLLQDTPANRKRIEKFLTKVEEAIALGTFNYREFFPSSKNAAKFDEVAPDIPLSASAQAVARIADQAATLPSGSPRPSRSGNGSPLRVKLSETELRQWRSPVGGGPSGNTCPRWLPQRAQTISSRIIP